MLAAIVPIQMLDESTAYFVDELARFAYRVRLRLRAFRASHQLADDSPRNQEIFVVKRRLQIHMRRVNRAVTLQFVC